MAPKKKGKGSKLSRMTEEERARYLQHRAAIEEEAKRRKQQLIATFMKNKLKHEEAFTRLNLAKINQQWRQILRQIKTKELQQDLENLWHLFEHVIESKNHITDSLLKELDESEEQYARNLQSHNEIIDQLIALHAQQLEELQDTYVRDRNALLLEASREKQSIISGAKYNEELLQNIRFQMLNDMETWTSVWKETYKLKTDEVKNNMMSVIDEVQCHNESVLEKLWKEFRDTLQEYINSTEDKQSEYAKLKTQDETSTEAILKHCKILTNLHEQITSLKDQRANLKMLHEQKTGDLQAERSYYCQYFSSLRTWLVKSRKLDDKQLRCLIIASNEAIKELESLLQKGERILKLASVCRRMETEREKVLPFVTGPNTSNILSEAEKDSLELACKQVPTESLAKEIFNYMKLENFWKRFNRAYLERAALVLHKEALILENQQLTRALQQYLATLAHGQEHPPSLQPLLSVARPVSTHIIREHINLMPGAGEEEMQKGKRQPKARPITCIEANSSVAVCLPLLLKNDGELLHPHLKEEEISLVLETCCPYINETHNPELDTSIHENTEESEANNQQHTAKQKSDFNQKMPGENSLLKQRMRSGRQNLEMCKVIHLLWQKIHIKSLVKELGQEISPSASMFIQYMKQLQANMLKDLSTSFHECARERYLQRLRYHNEHMKGEISVLTAELEEQNRDIQLKLMAKNLLINQNEAKIERLNRKCVENLKRRVYESEHKMAKDCKDSEIQQEILANEVRTLDLKMKSLLHTHLAQEKELRMKRLRVESQLISWLNKYDTDIGKKQAEYDEVLAGYEKEKQQMEKLQERFVVQQEEYERLMKEKADEEQARLEQKVQAFLCNRAARRIQRYWRAYRARKLARRKGRKKRKGGSGGKQVTDG